MTKYTNYINGHVIALAGAMALHSGIAAWAMAPSEPIILQQQVIQVSMVSPSSVAQLKEKSEVEEQKTLPKAEGTIKVKPKTEKQKKQENDVDQNTASAPPTSGPQAVDATDKVAARSEPVFNAAYLRNPAPVYPQSARRSGTQGKVLLEVNVTPEGTAREVSVATSSGSSLLDDAALDAVRQWKFIPARSGGEIVEAKVIVPVEFKLN
jgi:protein TonB